MDLDSRLLRPRNDSSRVEFELPMLEVGVRVPVIAKLCMDDHWSFFVFEHPSSGLNSCFQSPRKLAQRPSYSINFIVSRKIHRTNSGLCPRVRMYLSYAPLYYLFSPLTFSSIFLARAPTYRSRLTEEFDQSSENYQETPYPHNGASLAQRVRSPGTIVGLLSHLHLD